MTIVHTIDAIAEWLERNVCADVNLKPRSPEDAADTGAYDYELVHPAVFALYVPTKADKPPHVKATSPAICVQIVEGNDDVPRQRRTMQLRLTFSAWDPGLHGPDVFTPAGDADTFGRLYEHGPTGTFQITHTGWRDVWNFIDVALRAIETERAIGGYPLDPTVAVKWGAYDYDGSIADYYPFWVAWVELSIMTDVVTSASDGDYDNLLY